jgi:bifunctional non-homologous end joining protein LigD
VNVDDVALTHLDRVMFPDAGISKREVIGYYKAIAPLMLPELRGRPLSVERYTKGIDAGGFFQKHWQKHYPRWLDNVVVYGKTEVDSPIVNSAAALVYMANQGSIAFHTFTSRKGSLDYPDEIVFDLDPPDGRFDLARRAAKSVRAVLERVGLPAFVKTTGGKGLHVVVPTDNECDYAQVHALTGKIASELIASAPDLFTTEFYKKDRKGRLYLDIQRNGLGATFVTAYSLRGRPGAPVSAPLWWHELEDPELNGASVKLRAMADRVAVIGDPWATLRDHVGNVGAALARL